MKRILKNILLVGALTAVVCGAASCSAGTAYELAVKNGFTGTEAEWLQSLHGANGQDGEDVTAADLYAEAQKNGFTGTYIEFCQSVLQVGVNEDNDTDTIAKNVTSVVSIYCGFSQTVGGGMWGNAQSKYYSAAGSGVIIDLNKEAGNALIVTNYHVIYDSSGTTKEISDMIYLYTYGALNRFSPDTGDEYGDGMRATYIGGAMDYDIALLKIEGSEYLKNSLATEAKFVNSDDICLGEKVFAIGNPDGAGIAVTGGIISVESEYITMSSTDGKGSVDYRVMRTDAAINHGNSGGALFNAKGELIGITNAKNVDTDVDNMGYALPSTQVKNLCDNILANQTNGVGLVKVARFGIEVTSSASTPYYDANGNLRIREEFMVAKIISANSAAYNILKVGDVFESMSINDGEWIELKRQYQINDLLLTVRKGDVVKLKIKRDGSEKTVSVNFDKDNYFEVYR